MGSARTGIDTAGWSVPLVWAGCALAIAAAVAAVLQQWAGVAIPLEAPAWSLAMIAGLGGVVSGMGVLLMRWARGVRGALRAFEQGERSADGLKIDQRGGAPAATWNELVSWIGAMHSADRAERAIESSGRADARPGDDSLSSAVEALWVGMVLLDESLSIRQANGAAASLLRSERDALLQRSLTDVLEDERVLKAAKSVTAGLVRRKISVAVDRSTEDGGRSMLRCTVRPIRKTDTVCALMVIEDVTQQHEADRARSELVAQAAHELRTPLTNIRLYTEELMDGFGDMTEADRGQALSVVSQETRRLERIVSDMLSMSEIEAGKLSIDEDDVRIEDIVEALRNDYTVQAREQGLSLVFDVGPKLPVLRGDRDKITLAMHNLVSNAIKYTPPGGEVRVRVDWRDERLEFEVSDTGIGVPAEQLERIFDRFYRCRDERTTHVQGTGLGLALARDVARLHGGEVSAESVFDEGSRFMLELPAAA